MCEYKKIVTTAEVWAVIRARHHEQLKVFSSFSAPEGDHYGNPNEGRMMTEYGFDGADCPLIGADTRWDIDSEKPHKRINERHEYWLCLPIDSDT
jgi:hypothetical protein